MMQRRLGSNILRGEIKRVTFERCCNLHNLIRVTGGRVDMVVCILPGGETILPGFPSLLPTEVELGRDTE